MATVISLSGGLDSTSLLLHLLAKEKQIYAVTFNYGQKHKIEIEFAKNNIEYLLSMGHGVSHKIIDITDCAALLKSSLTDANRSIPEGHYEDSNMKSTFVPNRNAIFTSIIYGYALTLHNTLDSPVTISLGVHSGDHLIYPDCRPEFYSHIMNSFNIGNWDSESIDIYLPYINYQKREIIKDGIQSCEKLNLDYNEIYSNTITTYSPDRDGYSDGKTGSDVERILAFNSLGLKDPGKYNKSWSELVKHAIGVEKNHNT